VLLDVSAGRGDELDGSKLEAAVLEARDDGADQATLDAIGLDSNEAVLHVSFEQNFYKTPSLMVRGMLG